ncbi:hypothetical protein BU26DRAFT_462739 [Trematosphaeria pertusa]|uniref:TPR-like protein n=1 Tax=Trematosphaeria pertusa TaxID=390896 RepID=A0A6A6I5W1_9PLEO|nr:uncharacterized protein BU26DRAFT_462739 [Trematosphaeria pertusa]KAF2245741.1 hypothetical protein BU26DRAFT_462739 [Trematosphaeria pertusa]
MLERASTCLETGRRQLFRATKRCLRSRRRLHSSFWHHGASNLNLPIWWASSTISDHANGDVENLERTKTAATARYHDGPFLEFLYPEKTLALIRRLSTYGSDSVVVRRRQMNGSRIRQFSTSRWQPTEDEAVADSEALQAKEEMEELLLTTSADNALQHLLSTEQRGKQELAWQLYLAIPERSRSTELQNDLLEYLAVQDRSKAAGRALRVFDAVLREQRRASSYRIAISAYVALKMVGPAIQLYEEAAAHPGIDTLRVGIDSVLQRTVQDDQWDLSLRIFRTFLNQAARLKIPVRTWNRRQYRKNFATVWGKVSQLPDLVDHWQSLLDHVRQFQHELKSTDKNREALSLFVVGLVPEVMNQVIHVPNPDEDLIWDFFIQLFRDLRSLELPTTPLYEYIIPAILDTPRYRHYTNQRKIVLELYRDYQQQSLQNSGQRPSRYLISRLIVQHGEKDSMIRVDDMVKDLRTFHPTDPFTPQSLSYLIRCHAKHGDIDHVHEYFNELLSRYRQCVDLKILSSLPYAYARRVDVPGAMQQFNRIKEEFGLVPDIACWNALLLAYTRAEDLDGALECFNNCLESGMQPDLYTFGPMLDLCAERGDIEAFEALYSRAKQLNVPVETDRRARSGYVQAFLNADDPEGAEAIAHGMLQSWRSGTLQGNSLTHTWNILVSYYAVLGDLANSRRIYKQMIDYKIPLDSWTYSGLMRALVESKQTNAAYKILRTTMPMNNVRVHAFHYALVISGFIHEHQYDHARRAYKRMEEREVPQTESSRQASLLAIGVTELEELRKGKDKDPRARLVAVEEKLRESILADYGSERAHDQPSHKRYIDFPELSNIPQGYFALVIMLYTTRGAYDICKQLFEAAMNAKSGSENYEAPIALLTAIMDAHLKAKEYDEVEKCWELARTEAGKLVKTFQQAMHPQPPTPEFDSITDPAIWEAFQASRTAVSRRQILWRATRIYIRSLLAQQDQKCLQRAQRTIRNLLTHGFIVDNLTWNEFIQHLALRGRIIDAFSACEMYLMPRFPGWAQLNPYYIRHDRPGYFWMELRHYDVKRTSVLPRYKTLVVLGAAYAQIKRDEQNGLGYNADMGGWTREVLEQIAPLTIRAIETMPRTGDALQERYLQDA